MITTSKTKRASMVIMMMIPLVSRLWIYASYILALRYTRTGCVERPVLNLRHFCWQSLGPPPPQSHAWCLHDKTTTTHCNTCKHTVDL
jgi:hypothetical protein